MNKKQLIAAVATDEECTLVTAKKYVESVFKCIAETVANGEEVAIQGFGSFKPVHKPEREGRNPATGDKVAIKARTVVKFKVGKDFKDAVA